MSDEQVYYDRGGAPMPAGGRRQSVCGGRVVKGSRRDNLPALTLLQHIWAGGQGGDVGEEGVSGVGGDGRERDGRAGGGRFVGVKGLLSNRCAGARQVPSGRTGQTSAPEPLLVHTRLSTLTRGRKRESKGGE